MTTPRPIEPSEIRVGDRVRNVQRHGPNGVETATWEFTVEGIDTCDACLLSTTGRRYYVGGGTGDWTLLDGDTGDWTLLDRPEPPREVGSRWRDPETGAEYIKTDHPEYLRYKSGRVGADSRLDQNCLNDRPIIARLVPLDGTR